MTVYITPGENYKFEVGGVEYMRSYLSPFEQINVARLLGPGLFQLFSREDGVVTKISGLVQSGGLTRDSIAAVVSPLLDAFAELPDQSVEKVIKIVMRGVSRLSDDNPPIVALWDKRFDTFTNSPSFQKPDGYLALQIVARVLLEEYRNTSARHLTPAVPTTAGAGAYA